LYRDKLTLKMKKKLFLKRALAIGSLIWEIEVREKRS
jgi:hypothetical protein